LRRLALSPQLQLRLCRLQPVQRDLHRSHREPPRVGLGERAARGVPQLGVVRSIFG